VRSGDRAAARVTRCRSELRRCRPRPSLSGVASPAVPPPPPFLPPPATAPLETKEGHGVIAGNPEASSSTKRGLETGNAMQRLVADSEESSRRRCTPGPRAPRYPAAPPQLN
jgi:hypothetical protein